jgi:hypothetical protein
MRKQEAAAPPALVAGREYPRTRRGATREVGWCALRFVNIAAIGLGILQILAISYSHQVWAHFPLWLRTLPKHGCPSENVVRLTLQHELHRISLHSIRGLMLAKILHCKAWVPRSRAHPMRLMPAVAAR